MNSRLFRIKDYREKHFNGRYPTNMRTVQHLHRSKIMRIRAVIRSIQEKLHKPKYQKLNSHAMEIQVQVRRTVSVASSMCPLLNFIFCFNYDYDNFQMIFSNIFLFSVQHVKHNTVP